MEPDPQPNPHAWSWLTRLSVASQLVSCSVLLLLLLQFVYQMIYHCKCCVKMVQSFDRQRRLSISMWNNYKHKPNKSRHRSHSSTLPVDNDTRITIGNWTLFVSFLILFFGFSTLFLFCIGNDLSILVNSPSNWMTTNAIIECNNNIYNLMVFMTFSSFRSCVTIAWIDRLKLSFINSIYEISSILVFTAYSLSILDLVAYATTLYYFTSIEYTGYACDYLFSSNHGYAILISSFIDIFYLISLLYIFVVKLSNLSNHLVHEMESMMPRFAMPVSRATSYGNSSDRRSPLTQTPNSFQSIAIIEGSANAKVNVHVNGNNNKIFQPTTTPQLIISPHTTQQHDDNTKQIEGAGEAGNEIVSPTSVTFMEPLPDMNQLSGDNANIAEVVVLSSIAEDNLDESHAVTAGAVSGASGAKSVAVVPTIPNTVLQRFQMNKVNKLNKMNQDQLELNKFHSYNNNNNNHNNSKVDHSSTCTVQSVPLVAGTAQSKTGASSVTTTLPTNATTATTTKSVQSVLSVQTAPLSPTLASVCMPRLDTNKTKSNINFSPKLPPQVTKTAGGARSLDIITPFTPATQTTEIKTHAHARSKIKSIRSSRSSKSSKSILSRKSSKSGRLSVSNNKSHQSSETSAVEQASLALENSLLLGIGALDLEGLEGLDGLDLLDKKQTDFNTNETEETSIIEADSMKREKSNVVPIVSDIEKEIEDLANIAHVVNVADVTDVTDVVEQVNVKDVIEVLENGMLGQDVLSPDGNVNDVISPSVASMVSITSIGSVASAASVPTVITHADGTTHVNRCTTDESNASHMVATDTENNNTLNQTNINKMQNGNHLKPWKNEKLVQVYSNTSTRTNEKDNNKNVIANNKIGQHTRGFHGSKMSIASLGSRASFQLTLNKSYISKQQKLLFLMRKIKILTMICIFSTLLLTIIGNIVISLAMDSQVLMLSKILISLDIVVNCFCCVTLMFHFNHFMITRCVGRNCNQCNLICVRFSCEK